MSTNYIRGIVLELQRREEELLFLQWGTVTVGSMTQDGRALSQVDLANEEVRRFLPGLGQQTLGEINELTNLETSMYQFS